MFQRNPAFAFAAVLLIAFSAAGDEKGQAATPLADAVKEFNQKAQKDPIGKDQPPLTEDEVIASIRGWDRDRVPAADEVYQAYQKIADAKTLPKGAKLSFTTAWSGFNGYKFDVWWVDLSIKTVADQSYAFRLRDRKLSCRPLTPEELVQQGLSLTENKPVRIAAPQIDPDQAGRAALEQYDTDRDGKISGDELNKSPALKAALKRLDLNHDQAVSAAEITQRIRRWQDSKLGRMSIHCTVRRNGKPLPGAEVKFVPEKFLGPNMSLASGTTQGNGVAMISVPVGPDEPPGVPPGFYRVEITKPGTDIPVRYNSETILGVEVMSDIEVFAFEFDLEY